VASVAAPMVEPMTVQYLIGDVFTRMAELDDESVDLVLTSPPFLALRSYLPSDHPDKDKEIGSEATPAEYIDVMLRLTAEWRRLLAPHGSLVVELGDTFAGSGGAGSDYTAGGWRESQEPFDGSMKHQRVHDSAIGPPIQNRNNKVQGGGPGWPLAKSLTLIPEAYRFALAYGINPHTGQPSPAGQWRIRNVIRWVRPNPPVGALGDKFRPATSELVVAATSKDRWFDLDAVREPPKKEAHLQAPRVSHNPSHGWDELPSNGLMNPAGAPPLDWWKISPKGYAGAHYAVWPSELCVKPIKAMCPKEVCRECGEPRRRIVSNAQNFDGLAEHIEAQREKAGMTRADFIPLLPHYKNGDSITAQLSNWERGKNIPTPQDWEILKDAIGVSETFDPLIYENRSLIEYEHINDHPSGTTQDATGRIYNRLPARKDRHAPDVWSDCGHDNYRPGLVLDPFAGTGTTLAVAHGHGRDAIGIDIDERSAELARDRVGPLFLEVHV
jgi:site-specific DNA-methyltransferase (cytosine-N4-specific)